MKKIIHTSKAPQAIGPYSQAVEANGILFIAGQIGIDPGTAKLVDEGITEQTEQVMKNTGAILEAAGYSFNDVVKYTCLLTDMSNFQTLNAILAGYFPVNPPARATYAVVQLPLGALIEIETIAVKQS